VKVLVDPWALWVPKDSFCQALLPPVEDRSYRLKVVQIDRITALLHSRQEQDLLLDMGRQLPQVHDLRHASGLAHPLVSIGYLKVLCLDPR